MSASNDSLAEIRFLDNFDFSFNLSIAALRFMNSLPYTLSLKALREYRKTMRKTQLVRAGPAPS